jgi:hypothetical protein
MAGGRRYSRRGPIPIEGCVSNLERRFHSCKVVPSTEKGINLLSMSRFLEEVEEGVVCVLMLCEKGAKGDDDVPLELQEVLSEFDDLMPEDLPLVCRS